MKRLLKILAGIAVVLSILLIALAFSLNKIITAGFNSMAPSALGVPATLDQASLSILRGKAELGGLHIGNPKGFKTAGLFDLASVAVEWDATSLLADTLLIKSIAIDGLVLTYERGLLNSNLGALIDLLSGDKDPKDAGAEKSGKKIVIEKLTITGSKMNVSFTGAAALTDGGVIPIPLPPLTLTDLGKDKEGVTIVEAIQNVLKAILGTAGSAISGAGNLLGDGAKALGAGAWALGEGAVGAGQAAVSGTVDMGKAVVGGTIDAGKAVVGGTVDAGKAVVGGTVDAGKAVVGGATDTGKAVVGGTVVVGKAVVGGTANAGKNIVSGTVVVGKTVASRAVNAVKAVVGGAFGAVKAIVIGVADASKAVVGGVADAGIAVVGGPTDADKPVAEEVGAP